MIGYGRKQGGRGVGGLWLPVENRRGGTSPGAEPGGVRPFSSLPPSEPQKPTGDQQADHDHESVRVQVDQNAVGQLDAFARRHRQ